jgi:hypothetical protein
MGHFWRLRSVQPYSTSLPRSASRRLLRSDNRVSGKEKPDPHPIYAPRRCIGVASWFDRQTPLCKVDYSDCLRKSWETRPVSCLASEQGAFYAALLKGALSGLKSDNSINIYADKSPKYNINILNWKLNKSFTKIAGDWSFYSLKWRMDTELLKVTSAVKTVPFRLPSRLRALLTVEEFLPP